MTAMRDRFVAEMIERGVLKFGDFTLKSGRKSPYFFNLGSIDDGAGLSLLGSAYAQAIVDSHLPLPDVVFGPAYKGIPIAVATATALHTEHGRDVGVAYNRKEAKTHGEGGLLVGRAIRGRVLIVDDVMTAGTAVTEAVDIVRAAGGELSGVLVALDRQEAIAPGVTAVTRMAAELGAPVFAIATLADVIAYLDRHGGYADSFDRIRGYQRAFCVS
ncbi:MAG TPA: orotate phosphoribosyltransferase [Pseudomonadales bacterium]|nr:orotate phosphoribosyltransferase [Pseudomonadales bacterium]